MGKFKYREQLCEAPTADISEMMTKPRQLPLNLRREAFRLICEQVYGAMLVLLGKPSRSQDAKSDAVKFLEPLLPQTGFERRVWECFLCALTVCCLHAKGYDHGLEDGSPHDQNERFHDE